MCYNWQSKLECNLDIGLEIMLLAMMVVCVALLSLIVSFGWYNFIQYIKKK
jgi:hypothetical protein